MLSCRILTPLVHIFEEPNYVRRAILTIVVCLAGAGLSFAQEIAKPGPEHEKMKELEGKWDAVMEMNGQKSNCTATYKMICGGMWLASDFEGDLGGIKFEGHGLDGYDQIKKRFVGVWVDSIESAPMNSEGNYDPATKLLTMTSETTGPDGKPQKFKTTTEKRDNDHFTFKMYTVPPKGTEQLVFTIEYTRRK